MGEPTSAIVSQWNGLDTRGKNLRTSRKQLDLPRELVNLILDESGHLYMPRASELIHTMSSGDGIIVQIHFIYTPRGLVVQTADGVLYHISIPTAEDSVTSGDLTVTELMTLNTTEETWSLSLDGYSLIGNSTRGTGPHDGQTIKIEDDGSGGVTSSDVSSSDLPFDGQASYSTMWKGRRFVVTRGRQVHYSDLNEPLTFSENNYFDIGGDDYGSGWVENPGTVQGMVSWENVLLFFLNSSVWMMSGGGSPDSWQLQDTLPTMGNITWKTLQSTQHGVLTYGGANLGKRAIYNFRGNASSAEKTSTPVDELIAGELSSSQQFGNYILHTRQSSESDIQVLLLDLAEGNWSSFDGYRESVAAPTHSGFFITDNLNLYYTPGGSDTYRAFPRKPGRPAKVTLGWEDEGHVTGMVRFMGVKLSGKKSGGNPTVEVTARIPEGSSYSSDPVQLTNDVFDGFLLPLRLRGHAVEIELTITPDTDDDEVLIESLELISSRKGEKLSRV